MISIEDKKVLLGYIDELNLLPDNKQELLTLMDQEDLRPFREKFDSYLKMAEKNENEFYHIQQIIYDKEAKDIAQESSESEAELLADYRKLKRIENEAFEVSVDDYYDDVERELDEINDKTMGKIVALRERYMKEAEADAIKSIKDKLK